MIHTTAFFRIQPSSRKFFLPKKNSPANAEAAQLYRENMKEYIRRVKATVEESWLDAGETVEEDGDEEMQVEQGAVAT